MAADPPCTRGHDHDDHEVISLGTNDLRPCADEECVCFDYFPAWFRDGLHAQLWGGELPADPTGVDAAERYEGIEP